MQTKFRKAYRQFRSDSRGTTLIELMIGLCLLSMILGCAYYFLNFSRHALADTEAQFSAIQDARVAEMNMEKDLRKAKDVTISGIHYNAVTVRESGMTMDIYSDTNDDGILELVQYKLKDGKLVRGTASLGNSPTYWSTMVNKVKNDLVVTPTPIFSSSDKLVNINLLVLDEGDYLMDDPVSVSTSICIRSKGAISE